ncbi:MAG: 3-oxoacid CoA-transferase subunit A [Gammaproteobacteria bacterium]|jgi:3-oxoadipate CoA-transferase alpha subunit
MIDKRVANFDAIVADLPELHDGAILTAGGFGDAGVPEQLIDAVTALNLKNLTVIANNAGSERGGVGKLLKAGAVAKVICTFPRSSGSVIFEELHAAGKIELELVPQGTLAERLRAGGAGIPAFFTATAVGTPLAEGKECRDFDGREYLLERAIKPDVALVHAECADRWGNLVFAKTARNFNPVMAMSAKATLAQVNRFVDHLDPEAVVTPGIFVTRIVELNS